VPLQYVTVDPTPIALPMIPARRSAASPYHAVNATATMLGIRGQPARTKRWLAMFAMALVHAM
jgi:hypothetical protein